MSNQARVRFAPSPTGYIHVGSLRTALYNYLYAKKVGGKCILRIEDTDQTRFVEGATENLIEVFNKMGIFFDEGPENPGEFGPYFQSKRTEIYRKYAQQLIDQGDAYYCFCTQEDIEKMRAEQEAAGEPKGYDGRCSHLSKEDVEANIAAGKPYVIRLKTPDEGEITFYDVVREKVTFPWDMVDDQVLIKSDGFPTYHLANVVDDHLMEITHVIRGEEWLSSVPKHLRLYEAFGWKPPKMAHLPLLLNPDKSKLSKRQGDVAVEDFLEKGFLVETLINFVTLLGWHAKGDREIFSLAELEKEFSLKRISKSGAVFDKTKLEWMNGQYLRNLDIKDVAKKAESFFAKVELDISDNKKFIKVLDLAKNHGSTLPEIAEYAKVFYNCVNIKDEYKEVLETEDCKTVLNYFKDRISALEDNFNQDELQKIVKEGMKETGVKGKFFYPPMRIALFGEAHGPDIPLMIDIFGKEETINRINSALKY